MEKHTLAKNRLGICSWSLGDDLQRVKKTLIENDLKCIHLNYAYAAQYRDMLKRLGVKASAMMLSFPQEDYSSLESIRKTGGIMPTEHWANNQLLAQKAIEITAEWNVPYLSMHAGFIDTTDTQAFELFTSRILCIANMAAEKGILLLLETGQETAEELKECLKLLEHPSIGVNFDPANMLLYGKDDPINAIEILAPWIYHIHIKDAIKSPNNNEWGTEVAWGDGQVDSAAFINTLDKIQYTGYLTIERESGDKRELDISKAVKSLAL